LRSYLRIKKIAHFRGSYRPKIQLIGFRACQSGIGPLCTTSSPGDNNTDFEDGEKYVNYEMIPDLLFFATDLVLQVFIKHFLNRKHKNTRT
jgi:hypothetical protein